MDNYQIALDARESIKNARAELNAELQIISDKINDAQTELEWLSNSYLPLDDLKEGIIQYLCSVGQRYAKENIRSNISSFALNMAWGTSEPNPGIGEPIQYKDIESCIAGNAGTFWPAQVLTAEKTMFDDRALLAVTFASIESTMRNIMSEMSTSEFGYDQISEDEIGPGLDERRARIESTTATIHDLDRKKNQVLAKLRALD